MANNYLRAAVDRAGIDPADLAAAVQVDIKTVGRWLAGRTPHPRHRRNVARALNQPEHELWPDVAPPPAATQPAARDLQPVHAMAPDDVIASYPNADHRDAPDPITLISTATRAIDLSGDMLIELLCRPAVAEALAGRATTGCQIRILLTHEDTLARHGSIQAQASGAAQIPYWQDPAVLARLDAQRARGYIDQLLTHPQITARHIPNRPSGTIIRADAQMLISLALDDLSDEPGPLLHLKRHNADRLYDRYANRFEQRWAAAGAALTSNPDQYPHPDQDPDRYRPLDRQ